MLRSPYLWIAFLGAFLVVGGFGMVREWNGAAPKFSDRDASLRIMSSQHLKIPDALEQIRAALAPIPQNRSILVIAPESSRAVSNTYLLINDLAYPRPVWLVLGKQASSGPGGHLPPPPGEPLGAFAFFDLEPTPDLAAGAKAVGPRLKIVRKP